MKDLKTDMLKKRTYAKMQWGVKAYRDWRSNRMNDISLFDARIYESDMDRVDLLERDSFQYAMCTFLAEVRKLDGTDYAGCTLYHLIVSIQKHLNVNGKNWKLVEGGMFPQVRTVLNNLMKERASLNIGLVKRRAEMIDSEIEEKLWSSGVLGESNPDQLWTTVLFLIGLNIGLRAGDEHYALRRETLAVPSQLQFKRNGKGVRCLVYTEDSMTKTNDGGLASMRKERKVVWVYPSDNPVQCPVRITDKYISLLPPVKETSKKANFYLRSLEKLTSAQWYGESVVGLNTLKKYMKEACEKAKITGFITNHSLRQTGTTKLFRSGVDHKLIKEFTGHSSDAVDVYPETSHEQREKLSRILTNSEKGKETQIATQVEVSVRENKGGSGMTCSCKKEKFNVNECNKLGEMIDKLMECHRGGKVKVKMEIKFCEWILKGEIKFYKEIERKFMLSHVVCLMCMLW